MDSTKKIPCSVAVLTFNSEGGLRRCLESVKDFSEIIICDGGSVDYTLAIASEYDCKVIFQDQRYKYSNNKIADFSGVRNQTLQAATNDWFLCVDSDEYLSIESAEEIRQIVTLGSDMEPKVYHMLRKFEVEGKIIDCAGTYPSYQPRFFHKAHVEGFARKLHEKIVAKPGERFGYLKKATIVPIEINIAELKKKHQYYLQLEAERNESLGKGSLIKALYFNLRSVCARWVKIVVNYVICRGNRMPLSFEIVSSQYGLSLSFILFKILIKKI